MCGVGFTSDGQAGCTATLPAMDCPAGEMAVPGDTSCAAAGAPAAPTCALGMIAVPGDAACRAIADCGSAPWGAIPVDATTTYVDASYAGGASDGSAGKPFTTIASALAAAAPGAIVAVAAGSYPETLAPAAAVKLWGRCPSMVAIAGPAGASVLTLGAGASGSEVHTIALTGGGAGVAIQGGSSVTLDRIWVHDTALVGVDATSSFSLTGSVVERTSTVGVRANGGTSSVSASVIRDVGPAPGSGSFGNGITGEGGGTLGVTTSVVERTLDEAVNANESSLSLTGSVVRDTGIEASSGIRGWGVVSSSSAPGAKPPTLQISGSTIEGNLEYGVYVGGNVVATVDSTLVSDTGERSDGTRGTGLQAQAVGGLQASATITRSLFENNYLNGVASVGSNVVIRSSVVRDNKIEASTHGGDGVGVAYSTDQATKASLEVHGSLVERNEGDAISIESASAIIDSTLIRNTKIGDTSAASGLGILVGLASAKAPRSTVQVQATVIDTAIATGIALSGADVTIEGTVIRSTRPTTAGGATFGDGVVVYRDATFPSTQSLTMTSCLVAANQATGVLATNGSATVDQTLVTGTVANQDGTLGDGVTAVDPGTVTLTQSRVDGSARAGVSSFGATFSIGSSAMLCNTIDIDGEASPSSGQAFSFDVLETNDCGCDPNRTSCQVLSSSLEPPKAVSTYE